MTTEHMLDILKIIMAELEPRLNDVPDLVPTHDQLEMTIGELNNFVANNPGV